MPDTQPTTTEIRVFGASDDLLEFAGGIDEEFNNTSGKIVARLTDPNGAKVLVVAVLVYVGVWSLGFAPADPDSQIPAWVETAEYRTADQDADEPGYSIVLALQVPIGTTVAEVL